jgi:Aminomethyltransferase folate-binding domain
MSGTSRRVLITGASKGSPRPRNLNGEEPRMDPKESLEDKLQRYDSPLAMLRTAPVMKYVFPMADEYTNWRDEQAAWSETAVLYDQSFHMTDIYFKGPDVRRLFSDVGVSNLTTFGKNKAKQFLAVNHDGYVIADAILFGFDDDHYSLVGTPVAPPGAGAQPHHVRGSRPGDDRAGDHRARGGP